MEETISQYLSKSHYEHPLLKNPEVHNNLKYCVENIYGRKTALFCIDVEAFEKDVSKVTEIGICIYDPTNQKNAIVPSFHIYHLMPFENFKYSNGDFVPDHAHNFLGENTYGMSLQNCTKFVSTLIEKYFSLSDMPCCLVGHDLNADLKWFKKIGITFPSNFKKIDTQVLMKFLTQGKRSLTKCLSLVGIPHGFLHNAGNDAYYTMLLALKVSDPQARQLYGLDDIFPLDLKISKRNLLRKKKNYCPLIPMKDITDIILKIGDYKIGEICD